MRLAATLELYAGGVGSGCRGPHCGRPQTMYHGTVLDSARDIVAKGLKPNQDRQFAVDAIPMEKGYVYATTSLETAIMFANFRAAYEKAAPGSTFRFEDRYGNANIAHKAFTGPEDMNYMLRDNPELAKGAFTPAIVTLNLPAEEVNKMEGDPDFGTDKEPDDPDQVAFRKQGIFPAKYIANVLVRGKDGDWHGYSPKEIKNLKAKAFRQVHFVYFGPVDELREHLRMGGQVDDNGS
jgi:hypothetical protein